MLKTFANAWKLPDLRKKLLFTFMIIALYRIGCVLPVPYIDPAAIETWFSTQSSGTMLEYLNILSGSAFSQATLFALSVSPYITSSIVIQLLTIAIPALERLSKEGEEGKKKLTQITRYATVGIALITSYGYYVTLKAAKAIIDPGWFTAIVIISCHCAGAALIMWLAEKINENGIGNGISMILFANIIASLPTMATGFVSTLDLASGNATFKSVTQTILIYALFVVIAILIVAFVIFMTESERKIPVQYAKRVVGRKMYGGQSTNLPIKLNMSGVMPIIFASSILMLPATIGMFFPDPEEGTFWYGFMNLFSTTNAFYIIVELLLIIGFSYFWLAISFNPVEVANNLKKNGGFIPGLRPGKPTSDFISASLKKITLIGAFFLGAIAVLPMAVNAIAFAISAGGVNLGSVSFGGTSMLIVVGVVLETVRDLESQITMRHYKGFLG
ncbi:MAG: preprotein translocase subunit SecY [Clostridia bacterium]|nr:preprotein translocase subunit SecY [Clostridia bacterium]